MNSPIEKKITYSLFVFGTSMVVPKIYNSLSVKLQIESFSIEATNSSSLDVMTYIGLFFIATSVILLIIFNNQLRSTNYTNIIKKWISNIFTKKLTITLNEKNRIIDEKQYRKVVDLMINYHLHNKNFKLIVKSKKYQVQLQEAKKSKKLEAYNILKRYIISNNKRLNEYKNTLYEFIVEQVKNNYIPPHYIKDVTIGLVEASFYDSNTTGLTKIDLATINQDFSCRIFLTQDERKMLEEHIDIPISIMYIDYGYDIWDLPFDLVYKKAIPSIIYELYHREKNLKNLQKYMYLKIGIG